MASSRLRRLIPIIVLAVLLPAYLLAGRGEPASMDEHQILEEAFALAHGRSIKQSNSPAADSDRSHSRYSPLCSLWLVPWIWAAESLRLEARGPFSEAGRFIQASSAVALAGTVVAVSAWCLRLGYGPISALVAPCLIGLGTLLLPYAGSFYPQVLATPALVVAFLSIAGPRRWHPTLIFAAWMMAVAIRREFALLALAIVIFEWLTSTRDRSAHRGQQMALIAGSVMGVVLQTISDYLRSDALLMGAYGGEAFSTPLWVGLHGLLFSPGKGLLLFSPLLLASLLGLIPFAARERKHPRLARLLLLTIAVHFLIVAKWWAWHGAISLGPRLLLPILPLLTIPVADWIDRLNQLPPWQRRTFLLLAAASLVLTFLLFLKPMLPIPFQRGLGRPTEWETIYVPGTSVFVVQDWYAYPTPLLWSPNLTGRMSAVLVGLLGCLLFGILAAIAVLIRVDPTRTIEPMVHDLRPTAGMLLAISLAYGPDLAPDPWQRQPFTGLLHVPVTGTYTLFWGSPGGTAHVGPAVLRGGELRELQFQAGPVEVGLSGSGKLFWSIPGSGYYKQAVPVSLWTSDPPTPGESFRLFWWHWGWLFWGPIGIASLMAIPGRSRPDPLPPDGAMTEATEQ